jgi:hypothetical protein
MTDCKAAHMAEFDALEMPPETFTRVQFRGIGREALDVDALRGTMGEELLDDLTAMNRRSIPDDDYPTGHLTQQVFQKGEHIRRVDRVVLAVEVQLALRRDRGDRRQMVAGPPLPHDRGLPHRGIGADDAGQGIKARFVYEENRLLLGLRPFLRADQVCWRQRAMATSSRCRARRAGFCGLQRMALSKRPTWTGW